MHSLDFEPIGYISSCYKEKFGIPRQPGLVTANKSQLILTDVFDEECIRDLTGFSHIWVQFIFHATQQKGWKPLVRPPRLGGNKKVGVFASRSTFRPNPIGLSVVKLNDIEFNKNRVILHLQGCDLLDQTPVLDIKPYLPYVDSIPDASGGFAGNAPEALIEVVFTEKVIVGLERLNQKYNEDIKLLITQILSLDPKPSYQKQSDNLERIYRMKLYDFDLSWQYCENNKIKVLAIHSL